MRRTSALAVAAALTAALALSSCAGSDEGGDSDAGSGTESTSTPSASATTTPTEESPSEAPEESPSTDALVLALPSGGTARCMAPTPESLARFTHAFMGTVTSVDDEGVVLTVDHWFAGGGPATVRVDTETGTSKAVRTTDIGIFAMKEGKSYLVSGTDGYVALCGLSDRWSPRLEQLYMRAFPE